MDEKRRPSALKWLSLALLVVAGCSGGSVSPEPPPSGGVKVDAGVCETKSLVHALAADSHHTASCTDACGNGLNPPTGGPHCTVWLNCRVFDQAQPMCNWVHNLEHGHAVLLYNCPTGCPEIVDSLKKVWDDAGAGGRARRILITPDPELPGKVGAVVWGWSWVGEEFDADAVNCILSHQDLDAPEAGLACSP